MFTKNIFLKKKYDKTYELKINDVYVFVFFFFLIKFFYQHFFFFWIFFLKICGPPTRCTRARTRLRRVQQRVRLPMLDYRPSRARAGPTRGTAAASGRLRGPSRGRWAISYGADYPTSRRTPRSRGMGSFGSTMRSKISPPFIYIMQIF